MAADVPDTWSDTSVPVSDAVLSHWALESPAGYVLGIAVWSVYLAAWYGTVYAAETLGLVPFDLSTAVFLGGLVVTSGVSVGAVCLTAWNVPASRFRAHFVRLSLVALLAPVLCIVYFRPLSVVPSPYMVIEPLGLDVFVEHALLTTGVLGPAVGCAVLVFALLVLAFRSRL